MKSLFLRNKWVMLSFVVIVATAVILLFMGRVPICECGTVKLWHGVTQSSENSQHFSDWYTFSHIIHGFVFFWVLRLVLKKYSWKVWFFWAVVIESAWEILENTPLVINLYREGTISLDYYGDSVLNSVMDIVAMVFGFWMAKKLPVWLVIVLMVLMEVIVGYIIRDNLTLNVLMLLYPFEEVRNWQLGG